MSQVTLQLPQTLQYRLESLAKHEGVSLHEYILYVLAFQTRAAYTVQPLSQEDVTEQHAQFHELVGMLKQATDSDMATILSEREVVEPEKGLPPETIARVKEKIAAKQAQHQTTCKER